VVAGHLREQKLIEYTRGTIKLTDLVGLEKLSCECYRVVRDHLHSLTDLDGAFGSGC